jgi:DNA polymerase-3 subunit delta'
MFDKLIGNDHIKAILKRMLGEQRVPHSLLFAGVEGVGKKRFALELAKAFVCQNPVTHEACDECSACRRAERFDIPAVTESTKVDDKLKEKFKTVFFSEHSDVGMVVPLKKNILVDAVRDLERASNFQPYEAKGRFLLVDDCDKMNDHAANALLKTLEEPSPNSYIFLISSRPDSLLPTILSRCQTLRFAPVPKREIENHLLETKQFSPDDAKILAHLSAGSVAAALETDLAEFREQRAGVLKVLESLLVSENRSLLMQTAEAITEAKNKEKYENFLNILQALIHDVWTLRFDAGEIVNADIEVPLQKLAGRSDAKRLASWLSGIENMREGFAVNLNKKIATEALFMQMAG